MQLRTIAWSTCVFPSATWSALEGWWQRCGRLGISFNCLLNACDHTGGGNFREKWATIDRMEASGLNVDHYTLSIMSKAMKRINIPKEVVRALELLDQADIAGSGFISTHGEEGFVRF